VSLLSPGANLLPCSGIGWRCSASGPLSKHPASRRPPRQRCELIAVRRSPSARRDERPLLTSIDRWGHTPFDSTPLTGHFFAFLVRAHLAWLEPAPTSRLVERARVPRTAPLLSVMGRQVVELGRCTSVRTVPSAGDEGGFGKDGNAVIGVRWNRTGSVGVPVGMARYGSVADVKGPGP
jgi:hypothetical protein